MPPPESPPLEALIEAVLFIEILELPPSEFPTMPKDPSPSKVMSPWFVIKRSAPASSALDITPTMPSAPGPLVKIIFVFKMDVVPLLSKLFVRIAAAAPARSVSVFPAAVWILNTPSFITSISSAPTALDAPIAERASSRSPTLVDVAVISPVFVTVTLPPSVSLCPDIPPDL